MALGFLPAGFGGPIMAAALTCSVAAAASAPEPVRLRGGSYEVESRLELPNIADLKMAKLTRVCLGGRETGDSYGLTVLGDNNPLARCPTSNVRQEGGDLTFDIVCPGANQAKASARYVLAPEGFRGRIEMEMGGKNMTMAEAQAGRRVGECGVGGGAAAAP